MTISLRSLTLALLGLLLSGLAAAPAAAGEVDPLTLRVSDAVAAPGGLAAIVIRTYSSRPVGQGQLDFVATRRFAAATGSEATGFRGWAARSSRQGRVARARLGDGPLAPYLINHWVFSSNGDVQSSVFVPKDDPAALVLSFLSPSASVNDLDGPLAVLFLAVPREAEPGTVYDVGLDLADTHLVDGDGDPVPIEIEPGFLLVRAHEDPRLVLADGDKVDPGETAELGVETLEPFALAAAHVVLHYDPAIADGPPQVRFDRRYGRAELTADVSTPGTIVVDLASPVGALNRIPGGFIQVLLPTSPAAPRGSSSPLAIDRERSWLEPYGINGVLPLEMVDDVIEIRED